jgi:hypothetical protein
MKILKFPKPKGSSCPLCKRWVRYELGFVPDKIHIVSLDWHECIDRIKKGVALHDSPQKD